MPTLFEETSAGFVTRPIEPAAGTAIDGGLNADGIPQKCRVALLGSGSIRSYAVLHGIGVCVRVNGLPIMGGIRILEHRDEIVVGSSRTFFSAESTPSVEIYRHTDAGRRPKCPVCRNAVMDDQSVVRCPGCNRIFHQIEETESSPKKHCWTYSNECKFCGHPTQMSGEPVWRPVAEGIP